MFSCEICEIVKNIFFTERLRWLLQNISFFNSSKGLWILIINKFAATQKGWLKIIFWILIKKSICHHLLVGISMIRSSHGRCSVLRGVLKIFAKFTGKHLCQSLFLNKFAGLRPATLSKRDSGTGVFRWI